MFSKLPPRADTTSTRSRKSLRCRLAGGYTMVEMLAVISVVAVLSGISIPAMQSPTAAASLSTSAREFSNLISLARSEAIARHTVVRFAVANEVNDGSSTQLRKASLWEWNDESQKYVQITAWQKLPEGVAVEPGLPEYIRSSSYAQADGASVRGDYVIEATGDPGFATPDGDARMRYVEFLPSGTARVPGGTGRNALFVLAPASVNPDGSLLYHQGREAANWAQVNVDTLTGRVRLYRP
ncbi:GspH/FimT family pseudopilin [Verrucomicrobium spinosum]|uniref:GspH/FimT family pseudopilin n=1 Tax=Verrucomicrobium spinosum TaxID=2736 RepID=UPI0001745AB1|nr:GspH/FimT family pseudopilin [Verrucomicrobium spinosum]